jgi:ABC-type Fe3+-hydroxamate transport system substrate-binding protein
MKRIIILILFIFCCSDQNNSTTAVKPVNFINSDNKIPQRIISLSPAITEELYLLGAEDRLVANTFYCNRPEAAKKKLKIGNLMNFNLENVLELKPDLILCTSLANRKKINKLRQLNINVIETQPPKSFQQICDNFLKVGKAIGREEKAKQIAADIRLQAENIQKITENLPKKNVFIQIGAKPLKAVNRDYHLNDFIKYSGGINIYENSTLNTFSRESVLLADPDIIIIASMGFASDEEKKTWKKYKNMKAVKNNNIFIVDSNIFCNFALSSFIEALNISVSLLHPEVNSSHSTKNK